MKIGILDSGLGGLTVAAAVAARFPNADLVYLGDTARVPYGTRAPETIQAFALEMLGHLLHEQVDAVVVACNTISAVALPALEAACPVPLLDVVAPTVAAAHVQGAADIAVIGTRATVRSRTYAKQLSASRPDLRVRELACPLFVPLVEEGYVGTALAEMVVREQLAEFVADPPQLLILGCTHYPYLRQTIQAALPTTTILDSAHPTAEALAGKLPATNGGASTLHVTLTMASPAIERLLPEALKAATVEVLPPEALCHR